MQIPEFFLIAEMVTMLIAYIEARNQKKKNIRNQTKKNHNPIEDVFNRVVRG